MNVLYILIKFVDPDLFMPQFTRHFPLYLRYSLQHHIVRLLVSAVRLGELIMQSLVLEDEQKVPGE